MTSTKKHTGVGQNKLLISSLLIFLVQNFFGESYARVQPLVMLCNPLGWQSPHCLVTTHEKMKQRKKKAEHTHREWGWRLHDDNENHLLAFHSFLCESAEFLALGLCLWNRAALPRPSRGSSRHIWSRVSPFVPRKAGAWMAAPAPSGPSSGPHLLSQGTYPLLCECARPRWLLSPAWTGFGALCVCRALLFACIVSTRLCPGLAAPAFFFFNYFYFSFFQQTWFLYSQNTGWNIFKDKNQK